MTTILPRAALLLSLLLLFPAGSGAEVFVRWTHDDVPAPADLGIAALAVPASSGSAVREALAQGYRVYVEIDAASTSVFAPPRGLAGVLVRGRATAAALGALRARLRPLNARVLTIDERGKWPHIRSNWVTKNNDVLQVAGRSAQPWIENNAALARIAGTSGTRPLLTYRWTPLAVADDAPALENYLVAIAEAGSFRADLLLPLHDRFQQQLLLGNPEARRDWQEIRRYLRFYAGDYPSRYEPAASIGVVTAEPMTWFEVMNLLARHNLPFEIIAPADLAARVRPPLKMLLVLGTMPADRAPAIAAFERAGGLVRTVAEMIDPNTLALDIRRQLGSERRVIDVWNGITVIAASYEAPGSDLVLVTVVNYAHQPLPVQIRVPGAFAEVRFESPEEEATLLPHEHRNGGTEFVLPALRVGGRVFLTRRP